MPYWFWNKSIFVDLQLEEFYTNAHSIDRHSQKLETTQIYINRWTGKQSGG